ncbi:hypothetical protein KKF05_03620 [Patescibacteria group bacterium]|nr:hypothetical protein [Patescibacteria group bacterium]MBU1029246.1 hypothetical protein [Patescibacteria group bacterium]MBU1915687.1 hypothetical protein [Patescibacteria group bacterium]
MKEEEMSSLPIQFRVKQRDKENILATTNSGHEFCLTNAALSCDSDDQFELTDIQTDQVEDKERLQLARAIINEIVGADNRTELVLHEATNEKTINRK